MENLDASKELFSSFIIHDVSDSSRLSEVLEVLQGIQGTFAQRPWKGEIQSRQELSNLLAPGRLGLLTDSLTTINAQDGIFPTSSADLYLVASESKGKVKKKASIFRGGMKNQVSSEDPLQIVTDELTPYPEWLKFSLKRYDMGA